MSAHQEYGPGPVTAFVDQVARDGATKADYKAQRALDELDGHEDRCADRYANITEALKTIKAILGWAGGTIILLLLSTVGWLLAQQFGAAASDRVRQQDKIDVLQQQMRPTTGSTAH